MVFHDPLRPEKGGYQYGDTRRNEYGETEHYIGNGAWIGQAKYKYKMGEGFVRQPEGDPWQWHKEIKKLRELALAEEARKKQFRHWGPEYYDGQTQLTGPENPGVRKVAVSTYGVTIPISAGRRRVYGNVIDAADMYARLVGYKWVSVIEEDPCDPKLPEIIEPACPVEVVGPD